MNIFFPILIIWQKSDCIGDKRGRLVHLSKWEYYRKVEFSQRRPLSHIFPLEISHLYVVQSSELFSNGNL